ncbi:hypothetical protein [Sulfitobacter sp. M368]|uniref:hypothetical protein n=1 Tax=Sulfitobacter sp. M368 TaxID=2867021 RepID=UPI0021A7F611|nr:hypothetical protein [Sulfitobacter sp. M368]UWR15764.1 hypothetical protein K3754_02340 [Sulfitobacter sp. M368]
MAQALAIVGEAGIHGLEYNALLELMNAVGTRQSSKARISPLPALTFSSQEFEDYLILAYRFGYVERSNFREIEWKSGPNKSGYDLGDEIVRLTQSGWEYIEAHDVPIIESWFRQISNNVPVIVTSVLATLLAAWIARLFGWV